MGRSLQAGARRRPDRVGGANRAPRDRSNPGRQAQLRLDLAMRTIGGREFEQWQYEVTGGGRIWYCPDPERMVVLVTYAGVGHPRATDQ
jgi:hypothetical protein